MGKLGSTRFLRNIMMMGFLIEIFFFITTIPITSAYSLNSFDGDYTDTQMLQEKENIEYCHYSYTYHYDGVISQTCNNEPTNYTIVDISGSITTSGDIRLWLVNSSVFTEWIENNFNESIFLNQDKLCFWDINNFDDFSSVLLYNGVPETLYIIILNKNSFDVAYTVEFNLEIRLPPECSILANFLIIIIIMSIAIVMIIGIILMVIKKGKSRLIKEIQTDPGLIYEKPKSTDVYAKRTKSAKAHKELPESKEVFCVHCGNIVRDPTQIICEKCGLPVKE